MTMKEDDPEGYTTALATLAVREMPFQDVFILATEYFVQNMEKEADIYEKVEQRYKSRLSELTMH